MRAQYSWAVVAAVIVTACTTDDPSKGGLLGGMVGLTNGAYDKRIQDRQKTLEDEQDKGVSLQRASEQRQQEEASLKVEQLELDKQLVALRKDLNGLSNKVRDADRAQKLSPAERDRLQSDLAQMNRSADLVQGDQISDPADKRQKLQELQKRKAELEQALLKATTR